MPHGVQRGAPGAGRVPCCSARPRHPVQRRRCRPCRAARPCRGRRCLRRPCACIARTCGAWRGQRASQGVRRSTRRTWAVRLRVAAPPSRGRGGARRVCARLSRILRAFQLVCSRNARNDMQRGCRCESERIRGARERLQIWRETSADKSWRSRAAMASPAPRRGRASRGTTPAASEGGACARPAAPRGALRLAGLVPRSRAGRRRSRRCARAGRAGAPGSAVQLACACFAGRD